MKNFNFIVLLIGFLSQGIWAQNFQKEQYITSGDTLNYQILYPKNFSEDKQYPLLLFLHGAGERGSDNEKQLVHGSKLFLDAFNKEAYPAIVIFPQCPTEDYWSNATIDREKKGLERFIFPPNKAPTKALDLVMKLMDQYSQQPYANTKQIYVGGLSMGGMGTWELLERKPDLFAAAFVICGAGNPGAASKFAQNTPLWLFHGAQDDVVVPTYSINMVKALLENGATPSYSLYAHANHNSWDTAFSEPKLLPWLFSKHKQ